MAFCINAVGIHRWTVGGGYARYPWTLVTVPRVPNTGGFTFDRHDHRCCRSIGHMGVSLGIVLAVGSATGDETQTSNRLRQQRLRLGPARLPSMSLGKQEIILEIILEIMVKGFESFGARVFAIVHSVGANRTQQHNDKGCGTNQEHSQRRGTSLTFG